LVSLSRYQKEKGLSATIMAKLECFNPAGSAKDRVALSMILDAEEKGLLKAGGTVLEPTSGNTGIGLAAVAACRGYRVILTMPESMSIERRKLLAAYGAQIVLTPAAQGMQGAVDKAAAIAAELPDAWIAGQFINP
jgi:cysteine synthase A